MIEHKIWDDNPHQYVIGADEVGRGSIAGPIVAASVRIAYKDKKYLESVKDSKKMTENMRNDIFKSINNTSIKINYSTMTNIEIDALGISHCNKKVLEDVLSPYFESNGLLFVDYVKDINKNVQPITKGEDKSLAIALASIMAKVYRDTLMIQMSIKFPEYGLDKNKGYGTKQHYEAIEKHGIKDFHRKTFLKRIN